MSDGTKRQEVLVEPEEKLEPWSMKDLPEAVRAAAEEMGWNDLMPVQQAACPYLDADRDLIVQSRTGSGKTGAFLIPLIGRIDLERRSTQAIILVPTRELARQVYDELHQLARNVDISSALIYGGVGYKKQFDDLKKGAQIVVGTPGRVLDHVGRHSLDLSRLEYLVFDEADEMLSMGFYPDMQELRRHVPRERVTWMFSATVPYKVQMLADEFMRQPEFLSLSKGEESVSTMEHRWCEAPTMEKDQILIRLIELERPDSAIVFCNTRSDVEYVASVLKARGYNAEMLSGDLSQVQRESVMEGIRKNQIRFLVATDVAARGIDISDLSHVILYELPKDPELYIHRSGRTARAGNTGVVISLVGDMSEKSTMKKIGRKYGIDLVQVEPPTEEHVTERIGERITILLEDRWRDRTPGERKRIERYHEIVDELMSAEEEKSLLAMLLSDLYTEIFNAPQSLPGQAKSGKDAPGKTHDDRNRGGQRGKGGGKRGPKGRGKSGRRSKRS